MLERVLDTMHGTVRFDGFLLKFTKQFRFSGAKARKSKIPFEICTLPQEAIYRRADGGPPIMYIPKQPVQTDPCKCKLHFDKLVRFC